MLGQPEEVTRLVGTGKRMESQNWQKGYKGSAKSRRRVVSFWFNFQPTTLLGSETGRPISSQWSCSRSLVSGDGRHKGDVTGNDLAKLRASPPHQKRVGSFCGILQPKISRLASAKGGNKKQHCQSVHLGPLSSL